MKLKYLNKTLSITFEDKNVFFRGPKRASKKKKKKKKENKSYIALSMETWVGQKEMEEGLGKKKKKNVI